MGYFTEEDVEEVPHEADLGKPPHVQSQSFWVVLVEPENHRVEDFHVRIVVNSPTEDDLEGGERVVGPSKP